METFMTTSTAGNRRVIPEPLGRALPLIRRLLFDAGLSIVDELEVSGALHVQLGVVTRSCIVLLVDTPVLLLEAIALDRGAAVFLPLHVVICGGREASYVYWANPVASFGLRPPAPSKAPLEEVCGRITKALSELPQTAELEMQKQSA
jgi:hypothetical protein